MERKVLMKISATIISLIILPCFCFSQEDSAIVVIRKILSTQVEDWNNGDIEKYMGGYWNSDSLIFIGKSRIKQGWKNTLENYKKSYPDKNSMGTLNFIILEEKKLGENSYFIIGKWGIQRNDKSTLAGYFSLLWKKINGSWVIVVDHSS